ncbi:MAG: hypothetical protein ABR498_07015 [Candidatus Dormibacteria bacterium]
MSTRSITHAARTLTLGALLVVPLAMVFAPAAASASSGTWTVVPAPSVSTTENNALNGVACASATECWAVGFAPAGALGNQPLIERYDGNTWTVAVGPNPTGSLFGDLQGVTCVAASNCWAVGQQGTGPLGAQTVQTLVMHFDGSGWSVVASPNTSSSQTNALNGVTCTADAHCWAAGYADSGSGATARPLTAFYDGATWRLVPSADPGESSQLNSVGCWQDGCLAVGTTGQPLHPVVEQWDGSAWHLLADPTGGAPAASLQGVTCPANAECWAAGYATSSTLHTLVAQFANGGWTVTPSVNEGSSTAPNHLFGVTCADTTDCWSVGEYQGASSLQTLALQYDGSSWFLDSSGNVATDNNTLNGVGCASSTDCWAVGYHDASSGLSIEQTLIEHYQPTPVTQTPDVPWAPAIVLVAAGSVAVREALRGRRTQERAAARR